MCIECVFFFRLIGQNICRCNLFEFLNINRRFNDGMGNIFFFQIEIELLKNGIKSVVCALKRRYTDKSCKFWSLYWPLMTGMSSAKNEIALQ